MSASTRAWFITVYISGNLFFSGNARTDSLFEPGEGSSKTWRVAGAYLLQGMGRICEGLAAAEQGDNKSVAGFMSEGEAKLKNAAATYEALAKEISDPRKINFEQFATLDPDVASRMKDAAAKHIFEIPQDEKQAAALALKEVKAFSDWLEKNSDSISKLKLMVLQQLISKMIRVQWIGADVAVLMHEGLEKK